MKRLVLLLSAGLALVAIAAGLYYSGLLGGRDGGPSTVANGTPGSAAGPATPPRVTALGRIQPDGGVIAIGAMPADRLGRLEAAAGDEVKAGGILGYLDSHALRLAEKEYAAAQVRDAKARLAAETAYAKALIAEAEVAKRQLATKRFDIEAAESRLVGLRASFAQAEEDLARLVAVDEDLVSPQEIDHQALVTERAKQERNAAETQLDQLKESIALGEEQADAQLETARQNVARLQAAIQLDSLEKAEALAAVTLEQTILRAPRDGRVLRLNLRPGEMIGQQAILDFAATEQMRVVAEVYETDAGRIKPGQRATITSPALHEPLSGTVDRKALMVARNTVKSLNPAENADARVVETWIRLDDSAPARDLVGLQVKVEIAIDQ